MIFLGPKGVLEDIEEDNKKNFKKSKDVFFKISTNIWFFYVLIINLESLEKANLEYIRFFWISCVD